MRTLQLITTAVLCLCQVVAAVPSASLPIIPRTPQPGQSLSSSKQDQSRPLFEQDGFLCIAQQSYITASSEYWTLESEVDGGKYYVATVELDDPKELLGHVEARSVSDSASEQWQLDVTMAKGSNAVLAVHPRGLTKIQIIAHLYAAKSSGTISLFEGDRPPIVPVSWYSSVQKGKGRKPPNGAGMLPPPRMDHWMTREQWDCWRAGEEMCFGVAKAQTRPRRVASAPFEIVGGRPPTSPPIDIVQPRPPAQNAPV